VKQTILVPLDGSLLADQGLAAACRMAKNTNAELLLLSAVAISAAAGRTEREREHAALDDTNVYLHSQKQVAAAAGVCARTLVLPGDAAKAILFAAEERHVGLISMATHGRSGLGQALLGSVAAAVVRGTDTPILLSRAMRRPGKATMTAFRRIVVPLDGSPFAESALTYLKNQEFGSGYELILVRAVTSAQPFSTSMLIPPGEADVLSEQAESVTEQRRQAADAYLRAVCVGEIGGTHCRPVVVVNSAAIAIARTVAGTGADLVVLATHDWHGMDRLLYGSIARQLLRRVDAPVLLLHGSKNIAGRHTAATPSTTWTNSGDGQIKPAEHERHEQPVTVGAV
jgi:nucleotide-binding universal stress UspA family protein